MLQKDSSQGRERTEKRRVRFLFFKFYYKLESTKAQLDFISVIKEVCKESDRNKNGSSENDIKSREKII